MKWLLFKYRCSNVSKFYCTLIESCKSCPCHYMFVCYYLLPLTLILFNCNFRRVNVVSLNLSLIHNMKIYKIKINTNSFNH